MKVEFKDHGKKKVGDLEPGTVFRENVHQVFMALYDPNGDDNDLRPCVELETGYVFNLPKATEVGVVGGKFVED